MLNGFDRRSRYSFEFSLLVIWRRVAAARRHWAPAGGIRIALQLLGRLCCDLRDVQGDVLLLSAAFDGHGDVIRGLNGIEDILAALWVIQAACR